MAYMDKVYHSSSPCVQRFTKSVSYKPQETHKPIPNAVVFGNTLTGGKSSPDVFIANKYAEMA